MKQPRNVKILTEEDYLSLQPGLPDTVRVLSVYEPPLTDPGYGHFSFNGKSESVPALVKWVEEFVKTPKTDLYIIAGSPESSWPDAIGWYLQDNYFDTPWKIT